MTEHGVTAIAESRPGNENAPAVSESKYLYAIIAGQPELHYASAGLGGADIFAITAGSVSAVVSDVPAGRLRAERSHLTAHRDVLARLMRSVTPLPVSFGTVAASAQAVRQILLQNQRSFGEQLKRVAGKAEMGLRVFWDVTNIFEYFINTHPALRVARDHLFGRRREPTQDEKLELGRFFENLLEEDREACAEKVEEGLSSAGIEHKRNKSRNEREILSLACLIRRGEQAAFEAQVLEIAKLFNNNYAFDYSGPWPPYNFVQMDLRLGSHAAD